MQSKKLPEVSVIIVTKNEERTIAKTIQTLLELNCSDYEIVLVDGGSNDQTVSIAKKYGIRIIRTNDSTPGQGRNVGIVNSLGKIVAFIDGDCYAQKDWIKNALVLLQQTDVGGVGGPKIPTSQGRYLSRALLNAMSTPFASLGSTLFTSSKKQKEVANLPSCNVIYRRSALEGAGLYSEVLRFCEDVDLNHRVRAVGYRLIYSPRVVVEHDWKVDSFKSLFQQMYEYGAGRAMAIKKCPHLFSLVHAIPSIIILWAFILFLFSIGYAGIFIFITQILVSAYCILALLFAFLAYYQSRDVRMVIIAPIAYALTHIGYGIGFISGLVNRRI